jgi:hypothetical protein
MSKSLDGAVAILGQTSLMSDLNNGKGEVFEPHVWPLKCRVEVRSGYSAD